MVGFVSLYPPYARSLKSAVAPIKTLPTLHDYMTSSFPNSVWECLQ
ncbi:MAG: hypothetical protein KAI83_04280 [Thiomargarita sp.]|nr:hypothetical protein [Thiomargarita sp.]